MNTQLRDNANGVKGNPCTRRTSPGTKGHVRQVVSDRQPTTVARWKNNRVITLATWNVRTLHQAGKLENVKQEMRRIGINIMGMSEVRWTDSGLIHSDDMTVIFSGGKTHMRGVGMILDKELSKSVEGYWAISDRVLLTKISARPFNIALIQVYSPTADAEEEEIDQFYEELDTAKKHCKSQEVVIIMGDLNAKVRRGRDEDMVGPHGLGIRNDRGERWIEWCKSNEQVIMNTWLQLPKRR